jgi:hypothetical protein
MGRKWRPSYRPGGGTFSGPNAAEKYDRCILKKSIFLSETCHPQPRRAGESAENCKKESWDSKISVNFTYFGVIVRASPPRQHPLENGSEKCPRSERHNSRPGRDFVCAFEKFWKSAATKLAPNYSQSHHLHKRPLSFIIVLVIISFSKSPLTFSYLYLVLIQVFLLFLLFLPLRRVPAVLPRSSV